MRAEKRGTGKQHSQLFKTTSQRFSNTRPFLRYTDTTSSPTPSSNPTLLYSHFAFTYQLPLIFPYFPLLSCFFISSLFFFGYIYTWVPRTFLLSSPKSILFTYFRTNFCSLRIELLKYIFFSFTNLLKKMRLI